MFLEYYGLREQPFGVTPNPRYLYHSPIHREALASLIYGIEADLGFAALIAEPGMGKTTLLFYLLEKFRTTARTALIFQTLCSPLELLRYLANELDIKTNETDPVILNERIKDVLVQEAQARRRVIVIIDEAQNLDESVLETIRLLSDFETQNSKLLHIILAGQLQLAEKLAKPGMAQLLQRVSMLNRLNPLTPEETKNYIEYRLGVAGYRGVALFNDDAVQLIATMSGGVPRKINRICFNALSLGCALDKRGIDSEVIREVSNDLDIGDLLFQKGAITDDLKQSSDSRESLSPSNEPAEIAAPSSQSSLPQSSENKPLQAAPARQWPSFPVSPPPSAPPERAHTHARSPGFSPVRPQASAPAGTSTVRPFRPATSGQARPLTSAQLKPSVISAEAPPPTLVRNARPPNSQPRKRENASSSRTGALTLAGVLMAVLALAGWTLWVKIPTRDSDAAAQASAPLQTNGQEIDLPAPVDAPKINDAFERGRSAARQRASESSDLQQNVVKVSATKGTKKNAPQTADRGTAVVDFGPQNSSPANSRAVSAALIRKVQPIYPIEARRSGIQGSVTVAAVIGADGKPRNVRAVSGPPILARAATDAVSQWLYQPYFVNGRPVEVETEIVVDFALR
jgi:general secretion pathway protein A